MFGFLEFRHRILAKYIVKKVSLLYLFIFLILVLVIIGNRIVISIAKQYDIGAAIQDILPVILYDSVSLIPVILAFALFLSVIIIVGRLSLSNEMLAMNSVGLGTKHLVIFIQPMVILTIIISGLIVFYLAPLAVSKTEQIKYNFSELNKIEYIKKQQFHSFLNNQIVLYFDDLKDDMMRDVFVSMEDSNVLIVAKRANINRLSNNDHLIKFYDGKLYNDFLTMGKKTIVNFDEYAMTIFNQRKTNTIGSVESLHFVDLFKLDSQRVIIEFWFRVSHLIAIFVSSILACTLAKNNIQSNRNLTNIIIGVVLFSFYYNMLSVVESLAVRGQVHWLLFFVIHTIVFLFSFMIYKFKRQ